jgi:U-box domain
MNLPVLPSILQSNNNDVVRTMIVGQDDELARLSVAPPATENSSIISPSEMVTDGIGMAGIGSIAEAISATTSTSQTNSTTMTNDDTYSFRQMMIPPYNNEADPALGTYNPWNVVASGMVGNDHSCNYEFRPGNVDLDYENLELNFDDLYSDSNAEQPSPLVTQYASLTTDISTMAMLFQQKPPSGDVAPPIISAASSFCGASSSTNYDGDIDDRNENFEVDDNDYYQLGATMSGSSLSATDIAALDGKLMGYNKKTASKSLNESTTEKMSKSISSTQYADDSYILGTLILRVVAARGMPSVDAYYANSKNHSDGNRKTQQNKNTRNRDRTRRGGGGFFRGGNHQGHHDDDAVGTNPYASVRFTTLAESLDDGVCNPRRNLTQQPLKRCLSQQVQRTSTIYNSCQPVWPRGENMYMDVSHPMPMLPQGQNSKNSGNNFFSQRHDQRPSDDVHSGISKPSNDISNDNTEKTASSALLQSSRYPDKSNSMYSKTQTGSLATKERLMNTFKKPSSKDPHGLSAVKTRSDESRCTLLSPIVSCALFHAPIHNRNKGSIFDDDISKQKMKGQKNEDGDSDDLFLGMASIDITSLLTGKVSMIDEWLTLSGGFAESGMYHTRNNNNRQRTLSTVRIICEYEPTDAIPQQGDYIQFTKFCNPSDLYPLMATSHSLYKVEAVYDNDSANGDDDFVLISSIPSASNSSLMDGRSVNDYWKSSFLVHRYMLILCKEREPTIIETCREEIITVAERIAVSPLVSVVNEAVHIRVPEDGLLNVGKTAIEHAVSTFFNRWLRVDNGVQTFLQDITYATNWDGQHSIVPVLGPRTSTENVAPGLMQEDAAPNLQTIYDAPFTSNPNPKADDNEKHGTINDILNMQESREIEHHQSAALPNMPPCPITGVPMHDPVVAADGHTYEREAIARWLQINDRSPLTGAILAHKNLVPNYMLLSSLQDMASIAISPIGTEASLDQINSNTQAHSEKESLLGIEECGNMPCSDIYQSTVTQECSTEMQSARGSDDSEKDTAEIYINDS